LFAKLECGAIITQVSRRINQSSTGVTVIYLERVVVTETRNK
jgi:hypothetical protein